MIVPTDQPENPLIDLRRQSRFWKAQHHRAVQREEAFKEEISQLKRTLRDQYAFNEQLSKSNESQAARIAWLEQQLFGRKSEKVKRLSPSSRNTNQSSSSNTGSLTGSSKSAKDEPRKRGKQKGTRGYGRKRREGLPYEEIFIDVPEELSQCPICGKHHPEFPGTENSEIIDSQITLIHRIYR